MIKKTKISRMSIVTVPLRRVFVFMSVVSTMIVSMVVPAFAEGGAEPVEGANATDNVTVTETTYNWFYWPGWGIRCSDCFGSCIGVLFLLQERARP
jgi:hypothetical protein